MKNTLYRATQYLKYKKAKSIILIFLFTIMSGLLLFSATIDSTIKSYYQSLDTKNGIAVNATPKISQRMNPGEQLDSTLTTQQLSSINKLSYISDVVQDSMSFVSDSGYKKISSSANSSNSDSNTQIIEESGRGTRVNGDGLKMSGSTNPNLLQDFKNKTTSLSSGIMPDADDEIVVSESLATLNKWKLSDMITLKSSEGTKSVKYKIVGLYKYEAQTDTMAEMMVPENTMYTTLGGTTALNDGSMKVRTNTTFYLKSVSNFEQFKKDYYSITTQDKDNIELTLNDDIYQSTIKPLAQLQSTMQTVGIVILSIVSIIIAIISFIMIKERSSEIGVLYSLSESKRNIVGQFIIENLILLTIAFMIALALNFAFSSSIIQSLMNMEIFSGINEGSHMMRGGPMMQTGEKTQVEISTQFALVNLVQSYLAVVIVVVVITVITVSQILVKRPKEIINS